VKALLPFGQHKGYGLSLINEIYAAYIGGSLPTIRSRPEQAGDDEKTAPNFFFQVIHPDALNCNHFAKGRSQSDNVKAVIQDILGHGNEKSMLPGQIEHEAAVRSAKANGLLFTEAEIKELERIGAESGVKLDVASLKRAG
jgi:L-2-hydroxycarboxylate dehydrogenase (NAD+)